MLLACGRSFARVTFIEHGRCRPQLRNQSLCHKRLRFGLRTAFSGSRGSTKPVASLDWLLRVAQRDDFRCVRLHFSLWRILLLIEVVRVDFLR